jgi:UDP-2,3-diacylglucosamine pyrophosphatase LpxH
MLALHAARIELCPRFGMSVPAMNKVLSQSEVEPQLQFRSVFISDVHLGFRGCSAEFLLDFLRSMRTDTLYLVGDIIDVWSLKKSFFWPQAHEAVVRAILAMAKRGTRVIYIPGNHDQELREFAGLQFGNIEIRCEAIHHTADGKRLLVMHGDEFDAVIKASPLMEELGNRAYSFILMLNRGLNFLRRLVGYNYWSLAAFLKLKVKNATRYIANFERALAHEARRRGVDGIICGHIHHAQIARKSVESVAVLYCNDGDWVESCTTLAEAPDGQLSLLRWTQTLELLRQSAAPMAESDPLEEAA